MCCVCAVVVLTVVMFGVGANCVVYVCITFVVCDVCVRCAYVVLCVQISITLRRPICISINY